VGEAGDSAVEKQVDARSLDKTTVEPASVESAITAEQALLQFEARRVWVYAAGLAVTAVIGVVLALVLGGDPLARTIHVIAVAGAAVVATWYVLTTRAVGDYRRWKVMAMVYWGIVANTSGFYFYGVYSAYAGIVTMSAYAFYSGSGRRTIPGALSLSIVGHGGLGLLQLTGVLADRGLVELPLGDGSKLLILIIFQLILLGAGLAGTHAYSTMQEVIADHDRAQRALAVRDAQLAEAHEAARAARGPGEGRHTGSTLGRFQLGDILGRGAMGEVYAAVDDRKQPCAVKVLASHLHGNADALERFQREARAISRLAVPNIVRMIEVSPASSHVPFLAMERLHGKDLGAMIKEQPVRSATDVVEIVRAVAAGLDAAHDAGVIHRDLKPANLFAAEIDGTRVWKILDFGVSKQADESTLTGAHLVGTPGYMAPEQARGETIDRRADVYSLGVICYRLVTGRPVVVPSEPHAMIHEVVYRVPPAPSSLAKVSPAVEAVLAIALAKAPADRFATAGELAAAFAEAAADVLPDAIRERAEALQRRAPWGRWIRATSRMVTSPLPVR